MKRIIAVIFTLILLISPLFVSAFGANDNHEGITVYLSDAGNDANDGASAVTPFQTIAKAYQTIGTAGGTIVITDTFTQTANFVAPAHVGKITIKGFDKSSVYTNAKGGIRFLLGGETEFTDLKIDNTGDLWMLVCCFNNVTFTNTVTMTKSKNTFLIAGIQNGTNVDYTIKDVTVSINGGAWSEVIGAISGGVDGKSSADFKNLDVVFNISGSARIDKLAAFSRGASATTAVLAKNASCTINLNGGVIHAWLCMSDTRATAKNGYENGLTVNIGKYFDFASSFKSDTAKQVDCVVTDSQGNKIFYGISGDRVFKEITYNPIGKSKVVIANEKWTELSASPRFSDIEIVNSKTGTPINKIPDTTAPAETTAPETTVTSSYRYIDKDSGAVFTVPEGWKEVPLSSPKEYFSVKFENPNYPDYFIMFGAVDLWDQLSSDEKLQINREEFDRQTEQLKEALEYILEDIPNATVKELRIKGEKYYEIDATLTVMQINIPQKLMLCVKNGWCYSFGFYGKETTIIHPDFRALLESVTYPVAESAVTTEKTETSKAPAVTSKAPSVTSKATADTSTQMPNISFQNNWSEYILEYVIISLLFGIFFYLLPLAIYRFLIRKKPMSPTTAFFLTVGWIFLFYIVFGLITIAITDEAPEADFKIGWLWLLLSTLMLSKGYKKEEPQLELKHQNRREILTFLRSRNNITEEELALIDSFEYLSKELAIISLDTDRRNRKANKKRTLFLEEALSKLISNAQFKKMLKCTEYDKHYITDIVSAVFSNVYLVTYADTNNRQPENDATPFAPERFGSISDSAEIPLQSNVRTESVSTPISAVTPTEEPSPSFIPEMMCDNNRVVNSFSEDKNVSSEPNEIISIHNDEPLWCRMCGVRLESDSDFCHKCGTKVIR